MKIRTSWALTPKAKPQSNQQIIPQLAKEQINILHIKDLDQKQYEFIRRYFNDELMPVLTPMADDSSRPFPFISNSSLNIAISLRRDPTAQQPGKHETLEGDQEVNKKQNEPHDDRQEAEIKFATVRVPEIYKRLVRLPGENNFILIDELVKEFLSLLFPGYQILATATYRVMRDMDLDVAEEDTSDLLRAVKHQLREREHGQVMRLEVEDTIDEWLEDQLLMLGPQQAQNFHDITCVYEHLANQYGLWDAANIINSFTRSDQGFHHFRAWLIAQGKDVYLDALWNPDSLAEVELYGDCSFEQLSYVGTNAFQRLTGQSAYTCANPAVYQKLNQELGAEITYRDDIWYPRPMRALPAAYPRLCAARGGRKRFDTDEIGWNTEHPKIRQLLDQGKRYDESKRRPRENRGEIR